MPDAEDLRLKCSVSVSAVTACLDTPYGPSVPANTPKTDEVLTRCPASCSSSTGMNARTPFMTPSRFTPSTQSHSPGGHSHSGPCGPPTPALLHTTCTAPNADRAASRSAPTAARSATSVTTDRTARPRPGDLGRRLASAGSSTSAMTTLHALGGEPLGQPKADAAGRPGDDRDPAGPDRARDCHCVSEVSSPSANAAKPTVSGRTGVSGMTTIEVHHR